MYVTVHTHTLACAPTPYTGACVSASPWYPAQQRSLRDGGGQLRQASCSCHALPPPQAGRAPLWLGCQKYILLCSIIRSFIPTSSIVRVVYIIFLFQEYFFIRSISSLMYRPVPPPHVCSKRKIGSLAQGGGGVHSGLWVRVLLSSFHCSILQ